MSEKPYRPSPKTQAEVRKWNGMIAKYGETAVLSYLDWCDVYNWEGTPEDFKERYLGVAWTGCEYIKGEDGRHYRFRND